MSGSTANVGILNASTQSNQYLNIGTDKTTSTIKGTILDGAGNEIKAYTHISENNQSEVAIDAPLVVSNDEFSSFFSGPVRVGGELELWSNAVVHGKVIYYDNGINSEMNDFVTEVLTSGYALDNSTNLALSPHTVSVQFKKWRSGNIELYASIRVNSEDELLKAV